MTETVRAGIEAQLERRISKMLAEIGDRPSLKRFLSGHGNLGTRAIYVEFPVLYRRRVEGEKSIELSFGVRIKDFTNRTERVLAFGIGGICMNLCPRPRGLLNY